MIDAVSENKFLYSYDEEGDILYTYINKPESAYTKDDGAGIMYRTSIETGKPCGATIMDFKFTYKYIGTDALCFNIQHFLKDVTLKQVEDVIYLLLNYKSK